jgi:hypothetical protein
MSDASSETASSLGMLMLLPNTVDCFSHVSMTSLKKSPPVLELGDPALSCSPKLTLLPIIVETDAKVVVLEDDLSCFPIIAAGDEAGLTAVSSMGLSPRACRASWWSSSRSGTEPIFLRRVSEYRWSLT